MFTTLFRWQQGRQSSGYSKMLLATLRWPIKFDAYLLKFPQGSEIAEHTDPVQQGKHYRLNIVLKAAQSGGEFQCENAIINTSRIKLFRPDVSPHSVTRVELGTRYLLSVGWVRN